MPFDLISETTVQHFVIHLAVSVFLWLLVIAAILIDLWDGVQTARTTHQRIHSHKLRVTVEKISEYWRLMLIAFFIDTIGVLFPVYALPFLSILFCIGLIGVEAKSMFEHAKKRNSKTVEMKDIVRMVIAAANEKDARATIERFNEYLETEATKNKNTK